MLYHAQAGSQLTYTHYPRFTPFNLNNLRHHVQATTYFPARLRGTQADVRVLAEQAWQPLGSRRSINVLMGFRLAPMQALLAFQRRRFKQDGQAFGQRSLLQANLLYPVRARGPLRFLGNLFLRGTAAYDAARPGMERLTFNITKFVPRLGQFRLNLNRLFLTNSYSVGLSFTTNLPFAQATVTTQASAAGALFTETVRGAVGFDPATRYWLPTRNAWVGRSALDVRLFIDEDGDGSYDPDEALLQGGRIDLDRAFPEVPSPDGPLRIYNLLPYTHYQARINERSISNPFYTARDKTFSLVTDPNRFKRIDIPFYPTGMIEGRAYKAGVNRQFVIQGLRLQLTETVTGRTEIVPTFSDGSFYHIGLPPGQYTLQVDPQQLTLLKLSATPAEYTIEIRRRPEGDERTGLDFVLHPR